MAGIQQITLNASRFRIKKRFFALAKSLTILLKNPVCLYLTLHLASN